MNTALTKAEQMLGIHANSEEVMVRLHHIRQICWDNIIIPGLDDFKGISRLQRGILDLNAGEAWHAQRHMELVDFVWYFRVPIPDGNDPLYRKIEYAQNLWDFANRTMGGAFSNRVLNVHPKRVLIQIAPKIDLSAKLAEYRENKKQAIAQAMDELLASFNNCIQEAAGYQI